MRQCVGHLIMVATTREIIVQPFIVYIDTLYQTIPIQMKFTLLFSTLLTTSAVLATNTGTCLVLKETVSQLEGKITALEARLAKLEATVTAGFATALSKNPSFDSITLGSNGRWRIMPESNDIALVFRDMITSRTRDARYAMWNARYTDIY